MWKIEYTDDDRCWQNLWLILEKIDNSKWIMLYLGGFDTEEVPSGFKVGKKYSIEPDFLVDDTVWEIL
jgi:hypothetical protein